MNTNTDAVKFAEHSRRINFENWMSQVDETVERIAGCSVYDLPDYPFRDAYDDGRSFRNVAGTAIRNEGGE